MRAIFGLLLIMLGLAIAVVWMPDHNPERQLAVVTDIATQGFPRRDDPGERNGRTFSPSTPLLATVEQPNARPTQHTAATARIVATRAADPAPASPIQPVTVLAPTSQVLSTTPTVLAVPVTGSNVVGTAAVAALAAHPADSLQPPRTSVTEMSRYELVRSIQRELKRVGCYTGDVDGDWGTGSRRAMITFTVQANASLPVDQPDIILLTLLQNHQGTACARTCGPGQALSSAGRCVSNAVMVRRERGNRQDGTPWPPEAQQPTLESGWTTRVARAPASPQIASEAPAIAGTSPAAAGLAAGAAAAAVAATAPPLQPMPGRMAVGGPQGGSGAFIASPDDRSPARAAVSPQARPEPTRSAGRSAAKREAGRRTPPLRGAPYRYAYAPIAIYRAPRFMAPSAPQRRPSRNWTATFFGAAP